MEFCSACGKRMVLKRVKDGPVFVCVSCKCEKSAKTDDAKNASQKKPRETIVVIDKEDQKLSPNPTTKAKCPKCENNIAFTWAVQTRAGDEGATQFFRCTKCSHTFRLYT